MKPPVQPARARPAVVELETAKEMSSVMATARDLARFVLSGSIIFSVACGDRPVVQPVPVASGVLACAVTRVGYGSCALTLDGTIHCWGGEDQLFDPPPPDETFVDVVLGGFHGCALKRSGEAVCFGRHLATEIPDERWSQLAAKTGVLTCGVTQDERVRCWYSEYDLEWLQEAGIPEDLVEQQRQEYQVIRDEAPDGRFSKVDVYGARACALSKAGMLSCWGPDANDPRHVPPTERMSDFSLGLNYGCGLREDGTPLCWGDVPAHIDEISEEQFDGIFAGWGDFCLRQRSDGRLRCLGQFGNKWDVPEAQFREVSVSLHICGVTVDNELICWGRDKYGEGRVPPELAQ